MKAPQFLSHLSLVRCGARHALFREEQLYPLKQKFCFSGASLEGWLVCRWGAAQEPVGALGWGRVPLRHGIRRGHQSSLCLLPSPGKGHLSEPSLRGREVGKCRQTRRKPAGRVTGVDGGTPSCTEVPRGYGPHDKPPPHRERTRYVKLTEHRTASKRNALYKSKRARGRRGSVPTAVGPTVVRIPIPFP